MAPRGVPEWTVADFIHRGYWWTNRGEQSFPMLAILWLKCVASLRNLALEPDAHPPAANIGNKWIRFVPCQW